MPALYCLSSQICTCNFSRFWIIRSYFLSLSPGHHSALRPCLAPSPSFPHLTHLASLCRDKPDVSRDPVSTLHFYQISQYHILYIDLYLLSPSNYQSLLREDSAGTFPKFSVPLLLLLACNLLFLVNFSNSSLSYIVTSPHHPFLKKLLF